MYYFFIFVYLNCLQTHHTTLMVKNYLFECQLFLKEMTPCTLKIKSAFC